MLMAMLKHADVEVFGPAVVLMGSLIGFLTGLFGAGGGFLLTPCLKYLFGVPYPIAVGSGLAQIFVTGSVSAYQHWRKGNVETRLGFAMAGGALAGTEIGKRIMGALGEGGTVEAFGGRISVLDGTMNLLFLVLMAAVATAILRETSATTGDPGEEQESALGRIPQLLHRISLRPTVSVRSTEAGRLSVWIPLAVSLFVGTLTGLMGVGGGFVMFPLLIYVIGLPTAPAIGTSALLVVVATGYGTCTHYQSGHVEPVLVLMLLTGSLIGVQAGVYAAGKIKATSIRRYFAYVIGLGMLVVFWGMWRELRGS